IACPRKQVTFRRLKADKTHNNNPPQKRRLLFGCSEKMQIVQIPEAGLERISLVGYKRKKEHGSTHHEEVCRLHRPQDSQEPNNIHGVDWRGFFASLTIWAAFSALPVQAQELSVSSAQVQRCFASDAMSECLGKAAKACQSLVPVATTLDIVQCNQLETLQWETLSAREYEASKTYLIETSDPEAPILDALDNAQAAWVTFRDAECNLAYTQYWDGSIRNVVATNCQMRMLAERAVVLRQIRSPSK
ncbi:MAG: lysozyme inhibitor LprI family protein, partial [Pseudomonadota bacterium]